MFWDSLEEVKHGRFVIFAQKFADGLDYLERISNQLLISNEVNCSVRTGEA